MAESIHSSDTLTLKYLLESQSLFNTPSLLEEKKKGSLSPDVRVGPNGMSADMAAAFLGPTLWDRTLPYDDLKLEYMDLNEFLSENGIPVLPESETRDDNMQTKQHNQATENSPISEQGDLSSMEFSWDETTRNSFRSTEEIASKGDSTASTSREPSPVKLHVDFEPSPTDVALATIPGQETFNPKTANFNEDELRPQPVIKKSKKVYVPDEQKDERYWERRKKNNFAAKRSRDARRIKENQIAIRAGYLQKESNAYQIEIQNLKEENLSLKKIIERYETQMKLLNRLT